MYLSLVSNKDTYEWDERMLYGELFIQIADVAFPADGWTDIISSVLDMWCDSLISLLHSNLCGAEKELYFMDGPYFIKILGLKNEMVSFTLFDHYKQVNQEPYVFSLYNLLSEVSKVAAGISKDERLKEVSNVRDLQEKYTLLKKIAKEKGYKL